MVMIGSLIFCWFSGVFGERRHWSFFCVYEHVCGFVWMNMFLLCSLGFWWNRLVFCVWMNMFVGLCVSVLEKRLWEVKKERKKKKKKEKRKEKKRTQKPSEKEWNKKKSEKEKGKKMQPNPKTQCEKERKEEGKKKGRWRRPDLTQCEKEKKRRRRRSLVWKEKEKKKKNTQTHRTQWEKKKSCGWPLTSGSLNVCLLPKCYWKLKTPKICF